MKTVISSRPDRLADAGSRVQASVAPRHGASAVRLLPGLATLVLAMTLTACASLPKPAPAPILYDFGTLGPLPEHTLTQGLPAEAPLQLATVTAYGLPTNSQPVLYRFTYAGSNELHSYQHARWSHPVGQLVAQQLRMQLEQRRPVLDESMGLVRSPDKDAFAYVLRVDVEKFEQRFTSEQSSEGVVRLRASLIAPNTLGDRLVAQRTFEDVVPATSEDAAGGTQAMAKATQQAAAQIDQWVQSVDHQ